jgi:EAL domain-containing protein (putative c-di-GMP-specific phosphodiesterase class I)/cellulose synthase/poly-beta-1,6-N-acetylglucosamine synthase-like glycosyltransferase
MIASKSIDDRSARSTGEPFVIAPKGCRQWGRDKRSKPIPILPPPISDRRIGVARLALIMTVLAWAGYFVSWIFEDLLATNQSTAVGRTEAIIYLVIVTTLSASTVGYLLSRLGFFYRARAYHRASRVVVEDFFCRDAPSLTVLVPAYQEDARVVRNTLLSAALQEYPDMRIVLLIDDPSEPRTRMAYDLLTAAESLPKEIQELVAGPAARYAAALARFDEKYLGKDQIDSDAVGNLALEYEAAASWVDDLATSEDVVDHADAFFANEVLRKLAEELAGLGSALRDAEAEGVSFSRVRARQLYQRLAWIFQAELTSFQRKRFVSLSHEPNKAMNLNSYIGLMGGSYREVLTPDGPALVLASDGNGDIAVPDPDYVLTLDADSVLLPEYCLRLVHLLEQQEYRKVAIAQTPYSAFPGSATRIERMAGATTDLQHIVHQGLTYYDATFWVGANAVIRKKALDEIVQTSYSGDWELRTYIQDRTVIEDTESTIELGIRDWQLYNVPERLSYSATPPDFGSLCIQRRRWATGGLLILPKLHRQRRARKARGDRTRFGELFLRWNYMASITWSSLSLLVLLAFPFNATLISPWLFLLPLPYFLAMASDLRYCGYKRTDVVRLYGFNLILLPVNLAGVVATLVQAITASKASFARTPKIRDRTVTPFIFLAAPFLLAGLSGFTFLYAYEHARRQNMAYAALNVLLILYAIIAFIGVRNCIADTWLHAKQLLYKPAVPRSRRRVLRRKKTAALPVVTPNWRAVLHAGDDHPASWPSSVRELLAGASTEPVGGIPESTEFRTVFQPVFHLATGDVVGYEALSRFNDGSSTERRIADAVAAQAGMALEEVLLRAALQAAAELSTQPWLALKVSPRLLVAEAGVRRLIEQQKRLVVVEVTEPSTSDLTPELRRLKSLLPDNARIALEHVRMGYKTLAALVELEPDFVKLDRSAVAGIANDKARRVQVRTLIELASEHRSTVIATGIESPSDLYALEMLNVDLGQGFLLGEPKEMVDA